MVMQLADVPRILDALGLEKADQQAIVGVATERGICAGHAAVQMGARTDEQLQAALLTQASLRADAADNDFATIASTGQTQSAPQWLRANWGNNGVNPTAAHPTIGDGAVAAANVAQNITMLANHAPAIARDPQIITGAAASIQLARGITGERPLTKTSAKALMAAAKEGLLEAVRQSGIAPADQQGNPVGVEQFINARFSEITAGVKERLHMQHQPDSAPKGATAAPADLQEPGFFSAAKEALGRGFKMALAGAAVGLVAAGIAQLFHVDVVDFFRNTLGIGAIGKEGFLAAITTGAAAGAITGAVVGVPAGCYSAICKMQNYYHHVALPREHEIGKSEGVQLGAHLEHNAMEHELQSRQYRDMIAQRSSRFTEQAQIDRQNQTGQSLNA